MPQYPDYIWVFSRQDGHDGQEKSFENHTKDTPIYFNKVYVRAQNYKRHALTSTVFIDHPKEFYFLEPKSRQ